MNELYAVIVFTPAEEHIDDELEFARELARPYFPHRPINFVPVHIIEGTSRVGFKWKFRNRPKSRFKSSSFQTMVINDHISLIIGELLFAP